MSRFDSAIVIDDLRRAARRRVPRFIMDYVDGGAGNGGGIRRNIDAFEHCHFVPRGLVNVSPVETGLELFGKRYALPFGISAVGSSAIYHPQADQIFARLAREFDIPFILSGGSSARIEEIARLAPEHAWCQLYAAKNPDITDDFVRRARGAGIGVLVFTIDFPVANQSEVTARSGISLALGPSWGKYPSIAWDVVTHPRWALGALRSGSMPRLESWEDYAPPGSSNKDVARNFIGQWPGNQTWRDVERIRALWPGKMILKGLVNASDIAQARQLGIDAVTVSNHGGNKLDCMPASLDSLKALIPSVGGDFPLLFDGGIRRGQSVLKAMALGASFCFVGRATIYGMAAGGYEGTRRALEIISNEIRYVLAMIGCPDVSALDAAFLRHDDSRA